MKTKLNDFDFLHYDFADLIWVNFIGWGLLHVEQVLLEGYGHVYEHASH